MGHFAQETLSISHTRALRGSHPIYLKSFDGLPQLIYNVDCIQLVLEGRQCCPYTDGCVFICTLRERRKVTVAWWWSQVSDTVVHGLQITVVGMLLVFFTLGLVIASLVLLTRLPGPRVEKKPSQPQKEEQPETPLETSPQPVAAQSPSPDDELAQVAAIAVAILRGRRKARARRQTQARANTWRDYGRAQQLGL